MKDKAFIDTNIFVYAFLDCDKNTDHDKHLKAIELLESFQADDEAIISTQVLNEYYSALLKNKIDDAEIQDSAYQLASAIEVAPLSQATVFQSYAIRNRYQYSHWDALIIASALEQGCTVLYSEDMQHKQLINNQLRVINPFWSI